MKAGKKISQGSFGCVVTPAYNCKNKKNKLNNNVSKLLFRPPHDNSEIKFGKLLKKIDPTNKHFIYVNDSCNINIKKISNLDKKNCNLSNDQIPNYILKKGGLDLSEVKVNVKIAYKFTIQLLKSIKKLTSNGIINLDIKRQNIITDDKLKNTFIIDFGSDYVFQSFPQFFNNFFESFDFNFIRFKWGTYIWAPEVFRYLPYYNGTTEPRIKPFGYDDKEFGISKNQVTVINQYSSEINSKKWKTYSEKIMIYALGLALDTFYDKNVTKPTNTTDKKTLDNLKNTVYHMILVNPYDRSNINDALHKLKSKKTKIINKSPLSIKIPDKSSPKDAKKSTKKKKKSKLGQSCKNHTNCFSKICKKKKCISKNSKKSNKKLSKNNICKQFKNNPAINPITNRKIKINGPTYKKLLKQCN